MLAACSSDGRFMRPPSPNQTATIRTTTTLAPASTTTTAGAEIGPAPADAMVLAAPFETGQVIDARFTCKGANVSPGLTWSAVPDDAKEVVIALTDLDAPNYVHWVMAGLNPKRGGLTEAEVPDAAVLAKNGAGTLGYTGPCPPAGATHTYQLTLYAFTGPSGVTEGMDGLAALSVVAAGNVASATVTGTVSG